MPVCPNCHAEYRDGVSKCVDCGIDLVDEPYTEEDEDNIELYTCESQLEADLLQGILEDKGITCSIRVLESSSFPIRGGLFSDVRIIVPASLKERATQLIEEAIADDAISDKGEFV